MSSVFEQLQAESQKLSREIGEKRNAHRQEAKEALGKAEAVCRRLLKQSVAMIDADRLDEASETNNLMQDIAFHALMVERALHHDPFDRYKEDYDELKPLLEQAEKILSGSE